MRSRETGLGHVLVTCKRDNPASARVVQRNGGVLVSESLSERSGKVEQRYWIEL